MTGTRTEHDLIGERQVPADRYFGIQTLRALENFEITRIPISHYPQFIDALAYVKKAAALANQQLDLIEPQVASAIIQTCDEILDGGLHAEFVVDAIQGGAGTSTNMNANEVIANRANQILGGKLGKYDQVHPINHVNMSQSTNDVYPTALRLALHTKLDGLLEEMTALQAEFARKGSEFDDVIKMGRTQLQDAVPMTLGQAFDAYAVTIGEDIQRVTEAQALIRAVSYTHLTLPTITE